MKRRHGPDACPGRISRSDSDREAHAGGRFARGHGLLLVGFAAFTAWYLIDSYRASARVENLLLIVPVAAVCLSLSIALLLREVWATRPPVVDGWEEGDSTAGSDRRPILQLAALVAFLLLIPLLKLDGAAFVFLALSLRLQGERRVVVIIAYAALIAVGGTAVMTVGLSIEVPTLLFGGFR